MGRVLCQVKPEVGARIEAWVRLRASRVSRRTASVGGAICVVIGDAGVARWAGRALGIRPLFVAARSASANALAAAVCDIVRRACAWLRASLVRQEVGTVAT